MLSEKSVYIMILNWNGYLDTIECVESCLNLDYKNKTIVVIDNGSVDNSLSILSTRFPKIQIIKTGENLGYAGGNNIGIQYALERGADHIWLLNNDTVVNNSSLTELVKVVESDPRIGIVGSKIYYCAAPQNLWFAGGLWRGKREFAHHIGLDEEDKGQYDLIREVDYITGCSLLIKAAAVKQIGLMNADYFLYWEDVDWCARAAKANWMIVYVPKSIVHHKVSRSIQNTNLQTYYFVRNSLLFFQRHKKTDLFFALRTYAVTFIASYVNGNRALALYYKCGLSDYFRGRFGEMIRESQS